MLQFDKILHFIVGVVIALIVTIFANPIAGMCAALIAGFAKELVIDVWIRKGESDPMDILATFAGGFVVLLAY